MEYKSSAVCLHFTFQETKYTGKYSRQMLCDGAAALAPVPAALRSHPASHSILTPPAITQLSVLPPPPPKLILPFACPSACPPSPMIQKVSFEIQGSGGRNVAGSGVREAEREGIAPLQPFASMNQQPQSSCQAQGCWPRPGQCGGGLWGPRRLLPSRGGCPPSCSPRQSGTAAPALLRASLLFWVIPSLSRCQQKHT